MICIFGDNGVSYMICISEDTDVSFFILSMIHNRKVVLDKELSYKFVFLYAWRLLIV
jgi:hypothetical protein